MSISTTRKALIVAGSWPALLTLAAGVASGSPAQPGMAAPGTAQPGMSAVPAPAAPAAPVQAAPVVVTPSTPSQPQTSSLADWVPAPQQVMPVPTRPRPQQQQAAPQQTVPQQKSTPQTYITQADPDISDATEDAPQTVIPSAVPVDPHTLRLGTTTVALPEQVDQRTHDKAQAYVDLAEWNLAAAGDHLGMPEQSSDRMAAGVIGGTAIGAPTGALVAAPFGAVGGCGVGAVVGAVAGALIGGIPTAGALALPGAGIGAAIGCGVGGASGGLGAAAAGGLAGGLAGAGSGAVIAGADRDTKLPTDVPPLLDAPDPAPAAVADAAPAPDAAAAQEVSAPAPVIDVSAAMPVVEQVTQQVSDTVEQVVADNPQIADPVDSLRDAVAAIPPVSPDQLGGFAAPINDVLAAVQQAVAPGN
ncbi:hypothetical protein [Nocardia sp. NBC_00511]|uniref:hypothetical protein n=1 Tax=Nocardia sp. NBC_00511 TaxID=2903591 RepID=UPI002F918F01